MATQARLLLPTASNLIVAMTSLNDPKAAVLTQTAPIAVGASQVTVNFGPVNLGAYVVKAQAVDGSGTVQFQQTGTLNLASTQGPVTLNLVPVIASALNQLASGQSVSGTIAPQSSSSWSVPSGALTPTGSWSLALEAGPDLVLYAQDSDGTLFPASSTVGALTTVQPKNAGTSFITLYNPGTVSEPYSFTLNSTGPTVNSWTPYFNAVFAANSSTTVYVDLSDASSVTFNLPNPGGITFTYQNQDGTPLTGIATTGNVTVSKTALDANSNGFFLTINNTTGSANSAPGGREYFNYQLNPAKVTSFVYTLDTGTVPNEIETYSLNTTSGALAAMGAFAFSSNFTPQTFITAPGKTRLYVAGLLSGTFAVVAFNVATNGGLTQIGTYQTNTNMPAGSSLAITTEQYLYWVNNTTSTPATLFSEPLNADGSPPVATTSGTSLVTFSTMPPRCILYDPGYNALVIPVQNTGANLYQTDPLGGATSIGTPLSYGAFVGGGYPFYSDPYYHTFYFNGYSSVSSFNVTNSPYGASLVSSSLASFLGLFAANPASANIYVGGTTTSYLQAYSIATSGVLTAGSIFSSGNTLTVAAVEASGTWLLVTDSSGTLRTVATSTMVASGSNVALGSTSNAGIVAVRVQ